MKILVIMKRFGVNKDMVMQNFGRQIKLFEPLAKKHIIHFFCTDYTKKESKIINRNGIKYIVKPVSLLSLMSLYNSLDKLIKNGNYDIIVATTDPLIGIVSYHFSKKYRIPLVYDMQDEYSCYDSYKIPFVKYLDKKAIKNSDIVLTVSESLSRYIKRFRKKPTYTIQNGIDLKAFKKIEKKRARKILKLPKGKIIIYIGEISKFKGVDILIEAFREVKKTIPNSYLLLSGKISDNIDVKQESIIYKEYPKRWQVITALNVADVAVLPNRKSTFSEYCFPYKLTEYMASNLPIVATALGDASIMLSKFNNSLCRPNDKNDLADKIIKKASKKERIDYGKILKNLTWKHLANKLDSIIRK